MLLDTIVQKEEMIFTTNGNHWWNSGNTKHPEEVEWKPNSFREL